MSYSIYIGVGSKRKEVGQFDKDKIIDFYRDKIQKEVPNKYVSIDSNIIVTGHRIRLTSAIADRLRNCSTSNRNTSVISIADLTTSVNYKEIVSLNNDSRDLILLIHEFSHNIGLKHEMGTVVNKDKQIVTQMLANYVFDSEYSDTKNYFGEYIPKSTNFHHEKVKSTLTFNSDINISNLYTYHTCKN